MREPSIVLLRYFVMSWRERPRTPALLSSVIVGGGPGGLGPLVWAAQHGHLPDWLDPPPCGALRGSYLECLAPEVIPDPLRRMRDEAVTHEMTLYRDAYPPLP